MMSAYRAAVALNNTGVALLERGAYRQAMATLKDSLLVMKRTLRFSKFASPDCMKHALMDVETRVQKAVKRLANPQPFSPMLPISVVSHDGSLQYSVMKSGLMKNNGAFCAIPVRIEPADLRNDAEPQDTDLESAIILYNFALAHICMSKYSNSSEDIEQFREGSLKLLQMACTIASHQDDIFDDDVMDEECEEDDMICEVRLLLSAAALKNVVQVLFDMGRVHEADVTHHRLLELGLALEEMEDLSFLVGDSHSAAA
jgi:hypothetical protein